MIQYVGVAKNEQKTTQSHSTKVLTTSVLTEDITEGTVVVPCAESSPLILSAQRRMMSVSTLIRILLCTHSFHRRGTRRRRIFGGKSESWTPTSALLTGARRMAWRGEQSSNR